jgi:hypothetical protein
MCPKAEQIIKLMFCIVKLDNNNKMYSFLQKKQTQKKLKVPEGINFILRHFPEDKIFPGTISTKYSPGEEFMTYSKKEMFGSFEQADFIDCKIRTYAAYSANEYFYIHDNGIDIQQTPDFIFLEINNRSSSLLSSSSSSSSIDRRMVQS